MHLMVGVVAVDRLWTLVAGRHWGRVGGCGVQTITVNLQKGVTKGEWWYGGGGGGIEGGWLWSPDYNSETTEGGDQGRAVVR